MRPPILEEILDGPLFLESELPSVPAEAYEAPATPRKQTGKQKELAFENEDN
jgi:hypothetical protein